MYFGYEVNLRKFNNSFPNSSNSLSSQYRPNQEFPNFHHGNSAHYGLLFMTAIMDIIEDFPISKMEIRFIMDFCL